MMLKWAEEELKRAGYDTTDPEDGPNKWMAENVLELLRTFSNQGHSGMSAPFAIRLFETLASWKPITPLTGEEDEWNHVGEDTWQNKRDSCVFKNKDGDVYFIEGKIFWEWFSSPDIDNGKPYKSYYTSRDSRIPVVFPWIRPKEPQYIFVPTESYPSEVIE